MNAYLLQFQEHMRTCRRCRSGWCCEQGLTLLHEAYMEEMVIWDDEGPPQGSRSGSAPEGCRDADPFRNPM